MLQRIAKVALAASVFAAMAASGPASARTVFLLGAGFGATQEDYSAPGSIGFTVGALHAIPREREAVGIEVTYQRLGDGPGYYPSFQSVTPITVQFYEPFGVTPERMAYVTAGGGVYVRYWENTYEWPIYATLDERFAPVYRQSDTATAGGFNMGVGIKSRAPRGETTYGLDVRYHGMYPRGYASLWTFGARLYF